MPIYEFECAQCGARFEHLSRNAQDLPKACTGCGSKKIRKAFSAFSVASAPRHAPSACASCPSDSCPMSGGCSACDD